MHKATTYIYNKELYIRRSTTQGHKISRINKTKVQSSDILYLHVLNITVTTVRVIIPKADVNV